MRAAADELLTAFARSDLEVIARRCADHVVVWGTDEGESWNGKEDVLASFAGAFDLEVRWASEPLEGRDWLAGTAQFGLADGSSVLARVTMVFGEGLLEHAHYSIPVARRAPAPGA